MNNTYLQVYSRRIWRNLLLALALAVACILLVYAVIWSALHQDILLALAAAFALVGCGAGMFSAHRRATYWNCRYQQEWDHLTDEGRGGL